MHRIHSSGSTVTFWSEFIHLQNEPITQSAIGPPALANRRSPQRNPPITFHTLKRHLSVILQNCGFVFTNGEMMMDKIFNYITSTGHRAHRELAKHKQRAALPRSRGDGKMEIPAPPVRRPPALFGEWMVCIGLGHMYKRRIQRTHDTRAGEPRRHSRTLRPIPRDTPHQGSWQNGTTQWRPTRAVGRGRFGQTDLDRRANGATMSNNEGWAKASQKVKDQQ
jgi:hypothetical protein